MNKYKKAIIELLNQADIKINGSRPEDIQVHDERLYKRVLSGGSLALGESYMDGWWTCKSLEKLFEKIIRARLDAKAIGLKNIIGPYLAAKLLNKQKTKAYHIGEWHYDTGNDLYKAMLDKYMNYSCGYWKKAKTLDQAQLDKMDLICKKLKLKKGMTLLDIGCGWGGLLKYAAQKYGVKGHGVTVSKEQAKLARENCKGLPITIEVIDYRKLDKKFDRIVSIGMIEHVGPKNYKEYFKTANKCMRDDGIFLLHTIGSKESNTGPGDPWIHKYIFPDGKLPSVKQLAQASEPYFMIEDLHNFGIYYSYTLDSWFKNFKSAWPKLKHKYDERFYKMWEYYLRMFVGTFKARHNQLWQIVLSKNGVEGGYESVR
ncbi:cyclopropane fatty acyl phospholipid synthase [Candidatus Woesearchaeota archaeon]|nr:cyclopropane fatty acyl phospholipid synthase [Candidatus Woesearchaeota archaeon]